MNSSARRRLSVAALAGSVTAAMMPLAATAAPAQSPTVSPAAPTTPAPPGPRERALAAGDAVAAQGLGRLTQGADEDYVRTTEAKGLKGLYYLTYQKTYRGLEVVGADAVITADGDGTVVDSTAAIQRPVSLRDTTPDVTGAAAVVTARSGFSSVRSAVQDKVVVLLDGSTPTLAWKVDVEGRRSGRPSVQHVYVDATTGAVLRRDELVRTAADATGKGNHNGDVRFTTTPSGSSYQARSTAAPGLTCTNQSATIYTDSDNVWGNGSGTDLPTACVDLMYGAEQESAMLKEWAGRNGVDGSGSFFPGRVGMSDVNAYWTGSYATFGRNSAGTKQLTPIDVVAHEYGHGVFQFSGGAANGQGEQGGMNESTGDILGSATECYQSAKYPGAPDTCDYEIGEMANLAGQGPIRYMYDPSKIGDPNCATQVTSSTEVHKAAGPQNHWFYLLAEGSSPTNGQPKSPICSGGPSSVTGIGVRKATNIFLNGLQRKTSSWSHKAARVATLNAAKTLYPTGCTEFDAVRNAWAAVAVPAQSGEPTRPTTCGGDTQADYSLALSPTSGSAQPGSATTSTVTTATTAGSAQSVSLSATGLPNGATASFSPATVQTGSSSTMTITTSSSTPAGTYPVTVTASGTPIKTVTYTLTVGSATPTPQPSIPPDIDVERTKAHLQQLQSIASSNGGNRRAGSAGYTASASYVTQKLEAAGFTVTRQRCTTCTYPSDNIIADWPGGDQARTYMFGAHLDGISGGPGMNDNGSGSAGVLEVALTLAEKKPQMLGHVRFAFWTDEEQGLNGSKFYVNSLGSTARSQIKAYYNFDMIGSTNAGYFINNITSAQAAPMKEYWDTLGLQPEENVEGRGRSDDYPFTQAGIPASGYAMGASATKTSAQASKWGGTAGRAFDPCYHSACDSYPANVNVTALDRATDGIAHTVWKTAVGSSTPEEPPTEPGGGATYLSSTPYAIRDQASVESPISSTYGSQVSSATIRYDITHPCVQDLDVWLVAPDGTAHQVETQSPTTTNCVSRDGVVEKQVSFSSAKAAAGTWRLRIRDNYVNDSGTLHAWRLTLP